ncbi:hypothetical protein E7W39_12485 [Cronobacter sakazakii]|nr:unnamed protein product [Cronobacter sakazakii]EGL72785.1 hypothetical protein CSE899_09752 [Cronobacter sakazakii E899]MDK1221390.1 hypothetical protein [Cronobacter turicensis]CCK02984.1 Putative membrane protein precursor [Cronobacter sakazakii 701]CCK13392.1 Putative membrane protein precursor [Cronobacter sakazakii 680]AGE85973.1 hypothetical protein CSSP291_06880 [Cronobacter sakazakii SP291]
MVVLGTSLTGHLMGDNMKKIMMMVVAFLLIEGCTAVQAEPVQPDVKAFQDNADECQHFAGEWDSTLPKSRQKEIEAGVDKYCTAARQQQEQLKKKYKGNHQVEQIIAEYDL